MFDPSAPHIIILLVVVLLLFGSTRLPRAAKSLGQSMHIFKRSVSGLDSDDDTAANPFPPGTATGILPPASPPADHLQTQAQLADMQRQLEEMQKHQAGSGSSGQTNQF